MSGLSEPGQLLVEDRFRILVAIRSLEERITGTAAVRPLDPHDADDRRLLRDLSAGLDHVLLQLSSEDGDAGLGANALRLSALATDLVRRESDASAWLAFRETGHEVVADVMRSLGNGARGTRSETGSGTGSEIADGRPAGTIDADPDRERGRRQAADLQPARQPVRPHVTSCSTGARVPSVHAAARAAARRRATAVRSSPRP